jgi:hypothetical protein
MKLSIKNYWHPTPIFWRKLGDSLLAIGSLTGSFVIAEGYEWVGVTLILCSVLGKFITNMTKNDIT